MTKKERRDIILNFISKYPEKTSGVLTEMIVFAYPNIYPDSVGKKTKTRISSRVRYYRGENGKDSRKNTGHIATPDQLKREADHKQFKLYKIQESNLGMVRKMPKILLYDVETAPLLAFTWSQWQKFNDYKYMATDEKFLLTWTAKWLFEDKVFGDKITGEEAIRQDDTRILKSLCNLIEEADIIIAHNGNKYDIKVINGRRLKWGMRPMLPTLMIDTLLISRRCFNLTSHRLDYLHKYLGGEGKDSMSMHDWIGAYRGDEEAIDKMYNYNITDSRILEDVYLKIRPYDLRHPNIGLYIQEKEVRVCPCCGFDVNHTGKDYFTTTQRYETYRCLNPICGAISRSRFGEIPGIDNRKLAVKTAK